MTKNSPFTKEMYNKYLPAVSLLAICAIAISAIAVALYQVNSGPVAPTAPQSEPQAAISVPECFFGFDVQPPIIDLALVKSVSNTTPQVGQQVTFTITVTNESQTNATGVTVADAFPAGLTLVSAATPAGTSYNSTTNVWTIGNLNAGLSTTMSLNVTVQSAGHIVNYAQVQHADQQDFDSTPANGPQTNEDDDDDADLNSTTPAIDLELSKTVNNNTPAVGSNIVFTVTVNNQGNIAATGVAVTDALPAGLTYVSNTASQGTYNNTNNTWTIGNMGVPPATNSLVTLQITARVDAATNMVNYAQVSAANQQDIDSTPGNGQQNPDEDDDANVTIYPIGPTATPVPNTQADLSLTKRVSNITPRVGDNITYSIQVHNAGPVAATGVTVKEPLADGLTFVSATPSRGTYDNNTKVWTIGGLDVYEVVKLDIVATVTKSGQIINTAQVDHSDQKDPDSTPGNNIPTEDDQQSVALNPTTPGADLSLTKRVNNSSVTVGQDVVFTVEVHNAGPDEATNVKVKDILPGGIRFKSAVPNQGSYNTTDGVWTIGTIPVNAIMRIDITGTVTQAGTQTNVAEVIASDQKDPDSTPNNNVSSEDDQDDAVVGAAGLPRSGNASRTTLYILAAGVVVLITGAMGLLLLL